MRYNKVVLRLMS